MILVSPVPPDFVVTQPFGCTGYPAEDPLGSCAHFHRGVDLGNGKCGGPIYAAAAGTVHFAGLIPVPSAPGGQQSLITVDAGGGNAYGYIHQATWSVHPGDHVSTGQQVATVGAFGAIACHCHWFAKSGVDFARGVLFDDNGTWLDPLTLMEGDMNPATQVPVAVCTLAKTNVYSDEALTKVLISGYNPGATAIDLYSRSAKAAAIRLGLGAAPYTPTICYAPVAAVSNVRLAGTAAPPVLAPGTYQVR